MKAIPVLFFVTVLFTACSTNNVTVEDSFQKYFDSAGVNGCFALFDNGQGHFTIYNLPRYRDSAYSAGATFDIPELLIGLQTGQLNDEKAVLAVVDTVTLDTVNQTQTQHASVPVTIVQAFQSVGIENQAVFQKLSRNIGMDTLKKWVDSLHYGNQMLASDSNGFYHRNLKIQADEQLGLIKKLYFGQLPFFKRPQEIVRGLMHVESNSNYKLYYKTANQGKTPDGRTTGWAVGWIEENRHPYFFVVNLDMDGAIRQDTGLIGLEIAKKILREMGFFGGTK